MILQKLGDLDGAIAAFEESANILKTASAYVAKNLSWLVWATLWSDGRDLKALTGLRPEDSPQWSARADEAIESGRNLSRAVMPIMLANCSTKRS